MTDAEPTPRRKRTQDNRTIVILFDGWALEAMKLNWVVCRENTSPEAPERWIRQGYYSSLSGAIGGLMEELVRENTRAAAVKSLHELMKIQQDGLDRLTRALVGAIEELGAARARV